MTLIPAGTANPLPEWLPDETIFSLLSRYHVLSGNRLAATTMLALFGHQRSGSEHDFPSRLAELCDRTQRILGEAVDLCLDRTILPFYLPLQDVKTADAAMASLVGGPLGMLKYRLGILTSRFRANHPLKACPACMDEDLAEFGTPYWHRTHQFPGVWTCPRHRQLLSQATVKSTGVDRFGWVLPNHGQLTKPVEKAPDSVAAQSLGRLAQLVMGWTSLPTGMHISPLTLSRAYKSALAATAGATTDGRTRWAEDYRAVVEPLRVIPELAGLPATRREAQLQIDRWVFKPRGNTHPLRHLSLILWLFPDWQEFWQRYSEIERAESAPPNIEATPTRDIDPRPAKLLALLASGRSVTAAATEVGVDVGTAIAWAAKQGTSTARRAKVLKRDLLPRLVEDLRAGVGKTEAAHRHAVSVQVVTRLLRSEVGLQDAWHAARFQLDQERARATWLALIADSPGVGVTALRRQQPWAYAWLYRNDRDWLSERTRSIRLPRMSGALGRVDWDSRDTVLSKQVLRVAADIATGTQDGRVALWQIYQAIPELKAKLGALDRLPLTRAALARVTRPRRRRTTLPPLL